MKKAKKSPNLNLYNLITLLGHKVMHFGGWVRIATLSNEITKSGFIT